MTKEFDKRNAAKSRRVCEAMAEAASTGKRVLTERERHILDMWPRFEDGEPVMPGDKVHYASAYNDETSIEVESITAMDGYFVLCDDECRSNQYEQGQRVKRPVQSVLDADGVEIHVGDTVWHHSGFAHGVVTSIDAGSLMGTVRYVNGGVEFRDAAKDLTHTRPDSWERLVEDAAKHPCVYAEGVKGGKFSKCSECPWGNECDGSRAGEMMALDIVRRAKALAGVEVD